MTTPFITVIVLNYNGRRNLEECFGSLATLDYDPDKLELMLVDNGSTDASVEFIHARYPSTTVVELPENVGFGAGNNAGAKAAVGSHVVFLNNDMWVDRGLLRGFTKALATRPGAVAAGAKILSWDGKDFDFAGAAMHFAGMGYQEALGEPFDPERFGDVRPMMFACGGAMMIERDTFLDVGGFDEDFFIYYEDTDLGWRLWLLGHEVVFAPDAIVHHRHHGTMEGFSNHRKRVLYKRNSLASVFKNYSGENVGCVTAAAALATVDGVVASALAHGRLDSAHFEIQASVDPPKDSVELSLDEASTLVAVHELVRQLPTLKHKRADIQRRRKRSDEELAHLFRWPFRYWPDVTAAGQSRVVEGFAVADIFASLPRKIVVLSPDILPYPGLPTVGSGLRAWGLAEGLRSRGHDVALSMPRAAARGREDVLPSDVVERSWDLGNLLHIVARERADTVLVCGWPVLDVLPTENIGVPIVLDQPGPHFLERQFERVGTDEENRQSKLRALRKADFFTSSGRRQHAYFARWLADAGWTANEIETRSASIPFSMPPDVPRREPSNGLTFVYGGVFLPWQDPTVGLETVVAELERRGDGVLHLFGAHHPLGGIAESRIPQLFARLEQSPRVVLHEFVAYEDLVRFYARAHVAVDLMARNAERELAFTTRTVVYLWCGVPVIYNDYSELSEYIARYDAGWTVNPRDARAIRSAVAEIFANRDLLRRKSENAQRLCRECLDWTQTIEPLDQFVRWPSLRSARLADQAMQRSPSMMEKVVAVYRTQGIGEVARRVARRSRRRLAQTRA